MLMFKLNIDIMILIFPVTTATIVRVEVTFVIKFQSLKGQLLIYASEVIQSRLFRKGKIFCLYLL